MPFTEADRNIEEVRGLLTQVARKLQPILLHEVEGSKDYTDKFVEIIRKIFHEVIDSRNALE